MKVPSTGLPFWSIIFMGTDFASRLGTFSSSDTAFMAALRLSIRAPSWILAI